MTTLPDPEIVKTVYSIIEWAGLTEEHPKPGVIDQIAAFYTKMGYSTHGILGDTEMPGERLAVERLYTYLADFVPSEQVRVCTTRTPEPHQAGEFPMTCFACHIVADS